MSRFTRASLRLSGRMMVTTTKPEKLCWSVSGFVIASDGMEPVGVPQSACEPYSGTLPRRDDCSANASSVPERIFFTMPVHTGLVFDESHVAFATAAS